MINFNVLFVYSKRHPKEEILESLNQAYGRWGCKIVKSSDKTSVYDPSSKIDFICESDFNFNERGNKYHYIHVEKGVEIDEELLYTKKWDIAKNIFNGSFKLI